MLMCKQMSADVIITQWISQYTKKGLVVKKFIKLIKQDKAVLYVTKYILQIRA